jgi:hypothetical protein
MRWTRQRRARKELQGGMNSVSDRPACGRTALLTVFVETGRMVRGPARPLAEAGADGQVVWFWRPMLASSLAEMCPPNRARMRRASARRRWQSERRGDHEVRRNPLRGESRMIRLPCGQLVRLLRTTAGAIGTRLSLRPLFSKRGNFIAKPRALGATRSKVFVDSHSVIASNAVTTSLRAQRSNPLFLSC